MTKGWLTALAREIFRWYLRRFPLRDGKAWCYKHVHHLLAPPAGKVAVRLVRGFVMRLNLADPDQRRMYFYGDYDERREADLITRVLTPGQVFWDVGANIGYFTLLAAVRLENTGEVVAFEPQAAAWEQLTMNLSLNFFTQVRTIQAAVTDRAGEACLYAADGRADGRANLFQAGCGQTACQQVQTLTLDGWRADTGAAGPDFIKLDVEGAELAALRGARETLASCAPLLLVEIKEAICRALGQGPHAIYDFLGELGYQPAGLHRGRWRLGREPAAISGRNVLFLNPDLPSHRERAAQARVRGLS